MKSFKEKFSRFFEQPTRKGLREILRENYGELDSLDFKGDWPSLSKMGKHLLAFANSGGGCIIVGVMEKNNSLYNKGLENMLDKSTFHNGVEKYIPQKLNYEIINFNYEDSDYSEIIGKSFQVLVIEDTPQYIPFISQNDGDGIKKNNIYIRKGTKSLKASYEDLQKIINKKIETNYSTDSEIKLEEHLSQLKVLFSQIESSKVYYKGFGDIFNKIGETFANNVEVKENPMYPEESFDDFIIKMIKLKKDRIKELLLR